MRTLKRLYKWLVLSILLQLLLLYLINNFIINRTAIGIEAVKYTGIDGYQVPAGASDIKTSFDAAFVVYFLDKKLIVCNIKSKEEKAIYEGEDKVSLFKWLPDREMVIFSIVKQANSKSIIEVKTFDANTGVERTYPGIKNLPNTCETTGIELSPLTNVVYVEIKINKYEKEVFKFDIMNNMSYVMIKSLDTIVKEMNYSDTLVYQTNKNKIYLRNGKDNSVKTVSLEKRSILLGIDSEDNVFVGELDSKDNVNKILYKNFSNGYDESWQEIALKNTIGPKDIFISRNGDIFGIKENSIYDVKKDVEIRFNGTLVDVLNDAIISIENNELITLVLKK